MDCPNTFQGCVLALSTPGGSTLLGMLAWAILAFIIKAVEKRRAFAIDPEIKQWAAIGLAFMIGIAAHYVAVQQVYTPGGVDGYWQTFLAVMGAATIIFRLTRSVQDRVAPETPPDRAAKDNAVLDDHAPDDGPHTSADAILEAKLKDVNHE